jgi:DNA-binding transcriptional MerR regulator
MKVMEVIIVMDVFEKIDSVAKIIGVAPSTVKKYYLMFEEEGYRFKRSYEGHILFSGHDVELLKELIILKNQSGMTVKKAVKQIVKDEVITDTPAIADTPIDVTVMAKQVTTVVTEIAELKQMIKEQNELIKQQQRYIDEKLERRDQLLIQSLRESATTKEENKRKGFFSKLFGR